jgi:hypothetical protein
MDETTEEDVTEEIKEQPIAEAPAAGGSPFPEAASAVLEERSPIDSIDTINANDDLKTTLKFSDQDSVVDINNQHSSIVAPKDFETLEQKSILRNQQRRAEEDADDDDDSFRLNISDNAVSLDDLDIHVIDDMPKQLFPELLDLKDVVVLDDI